jgi:scyllo-inositol 2-dehydrogenase (NADP+)
MTDEIRVGLVGYGMAARVFHEPVLGAVPGLRIAKVVASRRDDPRAVFDDPEIDLVVVTTPNDSHAALVERALDAGKHVVVEKPFATTSADARRLAALARERGLVLAVHHNRRWDGDFLTVRRVLDAGLLGRLVELESRFDRFRAGPKPNAWRERAGAGAGVLLDLGSHLVDQALALFGAPESVTADVRRQRDAAEADDSFTVVLHYDRLTVTLGAGMLVRERGPRFVLHGTLGSFVKRGMDPQEDALKAGRTPAEPGWGAEPPELWGTLDTDVAGVHVVGRVETTPGAYQAFYANVRDAVRGAAELAVAPEAAAEVVRVIEVARRSSDERRTVALSE